MRYLLLLRSGTYELNKKKTMEEIDSIYHETLLFIAIDGEN